MRTSLSRAKMMASALLLSSLFPSEPSLAQGCPSPSFGLARAFAAGTNSNCVAVGDFNGDGKLDLAVANVYGNISVLVGNGDGTFQAAVSYPLDIPAWSVAVGDFNGDGKTDLAVAGGNFSGTTTATVSILLGNGDGTFQPAVDYDGGSFFLTSVAVSDLNGDGKADLVVANYTDFPHSTPATVSVLLGNGDGSFQAPVAYGSGTTRPDSLAIGDLNGDGVPDLIVANYGAAGIPEIDGSVSVLLGNGDGTFQAAVNYDESGDQVISVMISDFNGDGRPDLAAVTQRSTNLLSVLLGNGDGTFQPAVDYTFGGVSSTESLAVGDFNGDGKPDVVVANDSFSNIGPPNIGKVWVLLNTCISSGPELAIARTNNTATISWPLPSSGFVLESATSLSSPAWQHAVEPAVTNNGRLEVSVPVNPGERYFRLHKP